MKTNPDFNAVRTVTNNDLADVPAEAAYYENVAQNYERDRIVQSIWPKEQEYVSQLVEKIPHGASILDVPVGTGRFLEIYEKRELLVTGIDISEDMLTETAKKNTAVKPTLLIGNAAELHFAADSFDYTLCWRLSHLVSGEVLGHILLSLSRVTRNMVIMQTFITHELTEEQKLLAKLKNELDKKGKKQTPWGHIKTYTHKKNDVIKTISANNLKLKHLDIIEDIQNPEYIFYIAKK